MLMIGAVGMMSCFILSTFVVPHYFLHLQKAKLSGPVLSSRASFRVGFPDTIREPVLSHSIAI
jgi:hypothetical protein